MSWWQTSRNSTLATVLLTSVRLVSLVLKVRPSCRGMRYRVCDGKDNLNEEEDRSLVVSECRQLEKVESINLARIISQKTRNRQIFCSFELFPTSDASVYQRFFEETHCCAPTFFALTWNRETATGIERFPALRSAAYFPPNTLLHCTTKGLTRSDFQLILDHALKLGIANVFALQGDESHSDGDFLHAIDLVSFIRERYGTKFSICVAGYPEMHPKSTSKKLDLHYLKAKVDAGADFIITQMIFESQLFIEFVKDCRSIGISIPIIPGIYPFTSTKLLKTMSNICKVKIPSWLLSQLDLIEDDSEAVRKLGIDLSVKIIKDILANEVSYAYHLFTLNRSFSALEVYRQLSLPEKLI